MNGLKLKWMALGSVIMSPIIAAMEPHASNGLPYEVNVFGIFLTSLAVIAVFYGILWLITRVLWK